MLEVLVAILIVVLFGGAIAIALLFPNPNPPNPTKDEKKVAMKCRQSFWKRCKSFLTTLRSSFVFSNDLGGSQVILRLS